MRYVRITMGALAAVLACATLAPVADAGDRHGCDCAHPGAGRVYTSRGLVGRHRHTGGVLSYRDPCHPSTRYVIPRHHRGGRCYRSTYGTPWTILRRYLPAYSARAEVRRAYVRSFFLRRYPFCQGEPDEAARIDLLLAEAEADPAAQETLPPEARMHLAMARFFTADYVGARADFQAVLKATPDDTRALYGRLLCAVCASDWKPAARDLHRLAAKGEIRADDRLDDEGCFGDPKALAAIVEGLAGTARYRISDGDVHLVAAWALAMRGDEKRARSYVRLARRWHAEGAAVAVLERNLGMRAPTKAPAAAPTPVRAPQPVGSAQGEVIAKRDP